MARGITIGDVDNKLQQVNNNVVIPVSSGADVPEVVEVGVLKGYINDDTALTNPEIDNIINNLMTIIG